MKKLKFIMAAIFRGLLLLTPGAAFYWWAWGKVPPLFSSLAAIGFLSLYLMVFAFMTVVRDVARDAGKKKDQDRGQTSV